MKHFSVSLYFIDYHVNVCVCACICVCVGAYTVLQSYSTS